MMRLRAIKIGADALKRMGRAELMDFMACLHAVFPNGWKRQRDFASDVVRYQRID